MDEFDRRIRACIAAFDPASGAFPHVETQPAGAIHRMEAGSSAVVIRMGAKSRRNRVFLGRNIAGPLQIEIGGTGNLIWIGDDVQMPRGKILLKGHGGTVAIGAGTTCTGGGTVVCGQNDDAAVASVIVGDGGMWAKDVSVLTTDMHPIFDLDSGERVNAAGGPVWIEPHVWLGQEVSVMKNVRIGAGSCIGIGSVVARPVPRYAVAAGCPAKVLRRGVFWARHEGAAAVAAARAIQQRFPPDDPA